MICLLSKACCHWYSCASWNVRLCAWMALMPKFSVSPLDSFLQGLLNVPFWEYWTSPYSSHYRPYTSIYLMVGWCSMGTFNDPCLMFLFLECLLEMLEMLDMIPEMIDLCSMRAFCRAFNDLCCQWRRPLVHRSLCTAGSSTAAPALAAAVQLLHHSQILEADDSKRGTYPGPDDSKHKPMITLKNASHLIRIWW